MHIFCGWNDKCAETPGFSMVLWCWYNNKLIMLVEFGNDLK